MKNMAKFIMSLGDDMFAVLENRAKMRGISIQELLRAIIIPDWVENEFLRRSTSDSRVREVERYQNGPSEKQPSEIVV
jgi:hypothetical protein